MTTQPVHEQKQADEPQQSRAKYKLGQDKVPTVTVRRGVFMGDVVRVPERNDLGASRRKHPNNRTQAIVFQDHVHAAAQRRRERWRQPPSARKSKQVPPTAIRSTEKLEGLLLSFTLLNQ